MSGRLVFLMLFFNQNVFREKKNTCALHMYLNWSKNFSDPAPLPEHNSGYKASNRYNNEESRNQYFIFIFI